MTSRRRTAVRLDDSEAPDVLRRLRRAHGQVGGVIAMVEAGRDCKEVMAQLAAASRALDRAGFAIAACALERCIIEGQNGSRTAGAEREELLKLFLALA